MTPECCSVSLRVTPLGWTTHFSASGRAEILEVYPSQSSAMTDMRGLANNARAIDVLAVRALGIMGR
ncbi:MAG TPA: hypothetical protein VJS67_07605 [Pseudonocardiaceae bacterium]|nr:hypothetical protein [Pseudonocardiaceae bacterium]